MKPEFEYTLCGNRYMYRAQKVDRTEEQIKAAEERFNALLERLERETKDK
ncbi:hypothetical protein [Bacteroides graminisolvens]|nr:hypothetical protein [Bacteroides graminisolvens]